MRYLRISAATRRKSRANEWPATRADYLRPGTRSREYHWFRVRLISRHVIGRSRRLRPIIVGTRGSFAIAFVAVNGVFDTLEPFSGFFVKRDRRLASTRNVFSIDTRREINRTSSQVPPLCCPSVRGFSPVFCRVKLCDVSRALKMKKKMINK